MCNKFIQGNYQNYKEILNLSVMRLLMGQVIFFINCNNIFYLLLCSFNLLTHYNFLCSYTGELTDRKKKHIKMNLY